MSAKYRNARLLLPHASAMRHGRNELQRRADLNDRLSAAYANYRLNCRRRVPASPAKPLNNSKRLDGSGMGVSVTLTAKS